VAAHPVGHHEEAERLVDEQRVLVLLAPLADIGEAARGDPEGR
jgi:hypothetical protein